MSGLELLVLVLIAIFVVGAIFAVSVIHITSKSYIFSKQIGRFALLQTYKMKSSFIIFLLLLQPPLDLNGLALRAFEGFIWYLAPLDTNV